jgi:magnesium transporter
VDGLAAAVMAPSQLRIVATRGDKELLPEVSPEDLPALLAEEGVHVWIDSWGSENEPAVRLAREGFRFHSLVIEDCFEARAHPKIEGFEDHLFLITHGLGASSKVERVEIVELDVFLGKNYLFTYHERPSRSVAAALELITRSNGGPLRRGPAALLYTILERQVETMAPFLDQIEERIEGLEERVIVRPSRRDLGQMLALKRTTLQMRRWMFRQREVMLRLSRNEFALVSPQDAILFRDVYDHLHRYTDLLDNEREMITSLQETYLSVTNLRLGEIMKFLTIFTAVLMPLTVLTGVYGMNFEHMPELRAAWGYPAVLTTMAITVLLVLRFFRRKGWIGRDGDALAEPEPRR